MMLKVFFLVVEWEYGSEIKENISSENRNNFGDACEGVRERSI